MLLALAAALALADSPPDLTLGLEDIVSVDTTQTDVYAFSIPRCDSVKALYRDDRPQSVARTAKVVLTLQNPTGTLCLYRGVVLKGFLDGVYTTSQRNPEGTGFFLPPNGELSIRVKPNDPDLPRAGVEIQIPPGKGIIVAKGLGPDEMPPVAE